MFETNTARKCSRIDRRSFAARDRCCCSARRNRLMQNRSGSVVLLGARLQCTMRVRIASMRRLFQIAAWVLLMVIVVLSVVPPTNRPITPAPHNIEHLGIFLFTGLAFGLGYETRHLAQAFGLVIFSAAIELIQL